MIEGPITLIKMDIEGAEYRVLKDLNKSANIDRVGKGIVGCHADRMPHVSEKREKAPALARAEGVFQKLDFRWP